MNIHHSDHKLPLWISSNSIFLAGPTPRQGYPVPSWRPDAIAILQQLEFDGTVFVPEYSNYQAMRSYQEQVEWEWAALHGAGVIVFWVPRDIKTMPAFTTNVEFGFYLGKKAVIYGRPDDAPKNTYLDWLYDKVLASMPESTLEGTLKAALALLR